ncbi:C40 family peptidase [Clostridium septicum]|uniref:Glycoside hydrolase n=1 Tax=Clostridium septicum TaxID=1504 RepID=A0A9N7JKR1_CLOSE|nr:C40 family peptidase [Clostridium septicum]AYE34165.1 glycoside hydrolase [Clostridium septicum]QAS59533.1 glycoside hydrolase [Clostridium septicum]UEC21206.1 NlpC/P60 family protein [Clostridium septicum]USS00747.1 NlpC/P60 family protein [Clostridium septicum]
MRKKILSAVIAGVLVLTSGVPAFATPNQEVTENQKKYEEITNKINGIQGEIYKLNMEIDPLAEKVENNKKEMQIIKEEIQNTTKEIETSKIEMKEKEEVLGKRLRELYKSGGQSSYLSILFSAESFSDFISKLDSTTRLVNIDKKVVKDILDKQEKMNAKVASLEEKNSEIVKVNEETEKALVEFESKRKEQEVLINSAKEEQSKFDEEFLSVAERKLVEPQLAVLNSSSSVDEIQSAIEQLRSIRDNQLKSPIVVEEIDEAIEAAKIKVDDLKAQAEAQAQAQAQIQASKPSTPNRGDNPTVSGSASGIVGYAYGLLGRPYVWGATGPDSFDCSGFTSYVYRNAAGIEITRTTYSQLGQGRAVSQGELEPGDLVFTYGGDHVGIYVGGGSYIHAPQPGDTVKVSPITSFHAARRIIE